MATFVKEPVIIFRADGSPQIGLGHAMRSLTLVHILRDDCQTVLATRMMPNALKEQYRACGAEVIAIPPLKAVDEPEYICQQVPGASTIIMDGYGFNVEYQAMLAAAELRVVVVDDMGGGSFSADVIINHSPGVQSKDYNVSANTRLCLGLDYAILHPVFMDQGAAKKDSISGNVFLNMGGADPQNITARVLEALQHIPTISGIDVVVGSLNPHFEDFVVTSKQSGDFIRVHHDLTPEQMAGLMRSAHVGICPSSTVALEACACALPLVVGWLVDNQQSIYRGLVNRGLASGIGNLNHLNVTLLADRFRNMLDNKLSADRIRNKQKSVFSGDTSKNLRRCVLGCN